MLRKGKKNDLNIYAFKPLLILKVIERTCKGR